MRRHAPFIAIFVFSALLGATGIVERFDLKFLDLQFRQLRAWFPDSVSRDVVVIGVDEDTAVLLPEPISLWHEHFGRLMSALAYAKPSVVGMDIVFPDRSYDSVSPGSDKKLIKGLLDLRRSAPLVLGQTVGPSGMPRPIHPLFRNLAKSTGFALFPVDRDGVVRRFDERLAEGGAPFLTLAGEMARNLGASPRHGYIDYWRGAPFKYVSMHQVLQWYETGDEQSLADTFRDKPVLVGVVFPFEDRKMTAVQLAEWEPGASNTAGVLLHAQVLRNFINGGLQQAVSVPIVAFTCMTLTLLWFVAVRTLVAALLLTLIVLLITILSTWLITQGWVFPVVTPALTVALALGSRAGYDTLVRLRERRRLRASFGGYVSPSVMDEILAGRIHPQLGGTNQYVCILFSDIRGYTSRSENMAPEEVIRFLNRYFENTVALIHERGGTVMSFMGDGILAVFGAPKRLENPCRDAFEAGRAMLKYVGELNEQFRCEGQATMDIGIGLHAGEAVIGHVGSASRHDYTVIGDVTNVAARLESLTKDAGYRIVVSQEVAGRLGVVAGLSFLGPMAIKGHSPVEVHGYDRI